MVLSLCPECGKNTSGEAEARPECGYAIRPRSGEPEFQAYIRRSIIGLMILCATGLLIGIALGQYGVWGLSLLGLAVGAWKLHRLRKRQATA